MPGLWRCLKKATGSISEQLTTDQKRHDWNKGKALQTEKKDKQQSCAKALRHMHASKQEAPQLEAWNPVAKGG